jgi:hypothetical protein
VVPPRSDRVARAPPYSRTRLCSCPYGAVTRSGAPFQTLPVRKGRATGLVRVRSSLLAESHLMSFPPATEIFQFAGFASHRYGFASGIPPKGWVAPFGDLGITGRSPLPRAFRSVPRPSSPLGAKASTRCPSRARPRPAPKPRCAARSRCASIAPTGTTGPGVLHTHARARPIDHSRPEGQGGLSCHARFTVTTRFTMSKRPQGPPRPLRAARAELVRAAQRTNVRPERTHAFWWAWADLNGRPHAYQACALAS